MKEWASVLTPTMGEWCEFFFSSRRRHTRLVSDWSSDVCSSDLGTHFKDEVGRNVEVTGRQRARRNPGKGVEGRVRSSHGIRAPLGHNSRVVGQEMQIGRASCRERVEVSGGRGAVKRTEKRRREG